MRRFFRIYPPYLASIIMIVAIGVLFLRPRNLPAMRDVILHVFMVHNLDQDSFFKLTGSFWSLAVEWQLYLVYPLFLFLVHRLGFPLLLSLSLGIPWLLFLGCEAVCGNALPFWISHLPFFYWFTWGLGAFVAEQEFHGRRVQLRTCFLASLLGLVAVIGAHVQAITWLTEPAAAMAFAIWVAAILRKTSTSQNIFWSGLKWIGVVSYSMYLIHQPLLAYFTLFLRKHVFGMNSLALITFGAMLCFGVVAGWSYCAWRFIELPSQEAGKSAVNKLQLMA